MQKNTRRSGMLCLALLLAFAVLAGGALAAPPDIEGHWAENRISDWLEKGLITGYEDGTFRPDDPVTRAEFIALANRAFGFTEQEEHNFPDVSEDAWYAHHVEKAFAVGYISGYEDGSFRPEAHITRQEVASLLYSLMELSDPENDPLADFTDAEEVPGWSRAPVKAALNEGLLSGYPDKTFRPAEKMTRAESVVTLSVALVMEEPGAALYLNKEEYYPHEAVTLTVENTGPTEMQLGYPFQVEKLVNGEWSGVDLDIAWILVLVSLNPGETLEQDFIPEEDFKDEVETGAYRVLKEIECLDTGVTLSLVQEFEIIE